MSCYTTWLSAYTAEHQDTCAVMDGTGGESSCYAAWKAAFDAEHAAHLANMASATTSAARKAELARHIAALEAIRIQYIECEALNLDEAERHIEACQSLADDYDACTQEE